MNQQLDIDADPFATSLSGRRLGRYEVLTRLASGGMASVYVARALGVAGFERLFAVKVLHPHLAHEQEFITMFLDEARLAARIRHPNVVATTDISDTQDAGYYLVMDYIEGDHLGALLQHAFKNDERIPTQVTLRIIIDALEGLSAAHSLVDENGRPLNLVHRDISPHNIMVCSDGVARLTDFGVAKAESRLGNTRNGQFKGKLAYMAPEHASGGEADQRSDLFAMAIVLWEALAGRRLFRAENQAATLNKICLEPIPLLSEVDPELKPFDDLLAKGLARDPADRFQTAHEFAEAIEDQAESLGGIANPRAVAKLVREYAAEKIAKDHQRIREAISTLSQAPPATIDEESGSRPRGPNLSPDVAATSTSAVEHSPSLQPTAQRIAPPPPAVRTTRPPSPALVAPPPLQAAPPAELAESLEPGPPDLSPRGTSNRRTMWIAAVLVGLAAGVGVATLLWSGSSDKPQPKSVISTKGAVTQGSAATQALPEAIEKKPATTDQPPEDSATGAEAQKTVEPSATEAAPKPAPTPRATPKQRAPRPIRESVRPKPAAKPTKDDLILNPYR